MDKDDDDSRVVEVVPTPTAKPLEPLSALR